MRYEYAESAYVELSDSWTRREVREFMEADGEGSLLMLKSHIVSICLPGIASAEDITEEAIDEMDWQLWRWFSALPVAHLNSLYELGEKKRQQLLGIAGT
jgi:hypothetical protein